MKIRAEVEQAFQPYKIIIEVDNMEEHKKLRQAFDAVKSSIDVGAPGRRDLNEVLTKITSYISSEDMRYEE